ncbi:class I SAM-dependent methyltransferase [Cupriavidus agavae]|uniref:Methyltransferase family protein n=1 Tax=Cupriavidus agavae TaxID=1001822 RepID=A0A4V2FE99_9BURK|nr:class I SAM-dependent methyltransferase [Cupriavidus agavae]RZT29039.1 methyltransferase family protein [Cupriavidus agavae]
MDHRPQANTDQETLWNGTGGQAWVRNQATLDRMFANFEQILLAPLPPGAALRVLDVGCGTGAVTLAAARRLGASGQCLGADLSAAMLDMARQRAAREALPAQFVRADAQTHAFGAGVFDAVLSRFGVMFFDDPVAAFRNLRHATRPGGLLRAIAWRSPAENPFMTTAETAAAPLLPPVPARAPGAPGQFGFADRQRVAAILADSGWQDLQIAPIDVACTLPEPELADYIGWLGSVGQRLLTADAATRTRVISTVRAAFEPFVHGDEVRFTAACWQLDARATH